MRTKPPCYQNGMDCPKRKLLCHGFCKEFQAWKAEEEERKAVRNKIKGNEYMMYSRNAQKARIKKIREGKK